MRYCLNDLGSYRLCTANDKNLFITLFSSRRQITRPLTAKASVNIDHSLLLNQIKKIAKTKRPQVCRRFEICDWKFHSRIFNPSHFSSLFLHQFSDQLQFWTRLQVRELPHGMHSFFSCIWCAWRPRPLSICTPLTHLLSRSRSTVHSQTL